MIRTATRVAVAAMLGLLLTFSTAPAYASQTGTFGGNGGTPFTSRCPAGSYLVGIRARAGRLVDHVGAVCAAWDPARNTAGPSRDLRAEFGGPGGQWTRFGCPTGAALAGFTSEQSYGDSPRVVGSLEHPQCRSLATPSLAVATEDHLIGQHQGRSSFPSHFSANTDLTCPAGQVGVGIFGAAGQFVDRLGLVCEIPVHAAPPAPAVTVATAKDDVDVYDQPNGDVGTVIGMMRQGDRHAVLATSAGWSELADVPSPGHKGWVASDHLTFAH